MKEKFYKYACLLLDKGLNIREGQPLVITAPVESIDFIRVLTKCCLERGIVDIYYDWFDDELKHQQLLNLSIEDISNSLFFNKKVYDEYAKKDGAFLMLVSEDPDLMNDVDSFKLEHASLVSRTSRPLYKKRQATNDIAWCIASVSTYGWAKKIFKGNNCVEKLWDLIFSICRIDCSNPIKEWDNKLKISSERCDVLNSLNVKTLHYTNKKGTDLYIGLSEGTKWCGAGEPMSDGRMIVANIPTEEIFTSPNRLMTNGIVYNSKPLVYNGYIIDDFWIKFRDGKVVDFSAKKGHDVLSSIIHGDETSCYLGECALVPYDSPISNSGVIFYTTLFDENASCHLALGTGFPNTLNGTDGKNKDELLSMGLNVSDVHVDFMIGTSDLKIEGITYSGNSVLIFEDGNFSIEC